MSLWLFLLIFLVSGFFADLLTAFFHFGFDYVFPYSTPILGPIARSFRIHHDNPDLDPSDYIENLTRGAQAAILLAIISLAIPYQAAFLWFLISAVIAGMSVWAIFFHQIHSYSHMGAHLSGEYYLSRVAEIEKLQDIKEKKRQLNQLFKTVPIPAPIRILQNCRIILNPSVHNLHHMSFESDFSSVNGWSDWITNPLFRHIARKYKAAAQSSAEMAAH
tara:strand:- start:285 stop:941 length:657 start_codon:yes stop_codon:yes gene_type:complete